MRNEVISRRRFLGLTGAGAIGLGATALIKAKETHAVSHVGANDKIHLGFVGLGGMGRSHMDRLVNHKDVVIVAGTDPDAQRRRAAKNFAASQGKEISTYIDYREMLESHPEIDAVFVATPDHWHALASIDSIRAGKDVYCEKPLALTIDEGKKMVAAARRFGRIVQMGTQQRGDQGHFCHACELVRNGRIGELERVVCYFGANPHHGFVANEEPPPYLDWEYYLGPAPFRPYNRLIHPYNFRFFRDFSGGLLTDWGVHLFDIAQWGAAKDFTSPKRIEAEYKMYRDNMYDFPATSLIHYDYGDVKLEWHQGTDIQFEAGQDYGTKFYGTEGEVFVNRGGYTARNKLGNPINEVLGVNDERLYHTNSHHQNFFDSVRNRTLPICDIATGHRATAISHLGNIATWLGRPVDYDPVNEFFPGNTAANMMMTKPYRAPWHM